MGILSVIFALVVIPLVVGAIVYYLCALFPPANKFATALGAIAALVAFLLAVARLGYL